MEAPHYLSAERTWRRSGSNRRPPACKAGALPAELRPQKPKDLGVERMAYALRQHRTATPSRCEPPLSLRGTFSFTKGKGKMGQGGLEPPTPRLSSVCSNQLSYWPPRSKHTTRGSAQSRDQMNTTISIPNGTNPSGMRGRRLPNPLAGARPASTQTRMPVQHHGSGG